MWTGGLRWGQSSSSLFDDVKTCALWAPDDRADDSSFFVFFLCNSPQIQSGSKGLLSYPRSKLKRLSVRDYGLSTTFNLQVKRTCSLYMLTTTTNNNNCINVAGDVCVLEQ